MNNEEWWEKATRTKKRGRPRGSYKSNKTTVPEDYPDFSSLVWYEHATRSDRAIVQPTELERFNCFVDYHKAIRQGRLRPATHCEACGRLPKKSVRGYHPDYALPLEVIWLCGRCHKLYHLEGHPMRRN